MKLSVEGMSCGGCVRSVEKILTKRGAADVVVSLENKSAEFTGDFNDETVAELVAALSKAGFEAKPDS